jgi:hypothetical protein
MDRRLVLAACVAAVICLTLPAVASAAASWAGTWVKVADGAAYTPTSSVKVSFYGTCTYDDYFHTQLVPAISGDLTSGPKWTNMPVDDSGFEQNGKYMTSWVSGAEGDIPLAPGDGVKRVQMQIWNQAITAFSPIYTATVTLDTRGPRTVAPYRLTAKKGGYVTVSYQAQDELSPTATVSIQLRSSAGKKLKTIHLGDQETGKLLTYLLKVSLPNGAYKYAVLATDLAGNAASKVGTNGLTVR